MISGDKAISSQDCHVGISALSRLRSRRFRSSHCAIVTRERFAETSGNDRANERHVVLKRRITSNGKVERELVS